jgi:magnesium transporter
MLRILARGGALAQSTSDPDAIWFDLDKPDETEEASVETALSIDVPTPAERSAFEESARFYEDGDALHVTVTLLGKRDEGPFISGAVSFVLVSDKLVTVRQISPRAFEVGQGRASARIGSAKTGSDVFVALIEGAAERLADLLAEGTREVNELSAKVFMPGSSAVLRDYLRELGKVGALTALSHESLSSLHRMLAYTRAVCKRHGLDAAKLSQLERDVVELERIAEQLQVRVAYVQDAALGMIGATQADALKALSLATIAFVPATLIASIFGMNFEAMHWFKTDWGPWVAFLLMLIAPLALFGIARWRRWF